MGTPPPSQNGVSSPTPPLPPGLVRRLLQSVPPLVMLAALGGAAYWGHTTGWSFAPASARDESPPDSPQAVSRPTVRFTANTGTSSLLPGRDAQVEYGSKADATAAGIDTAVAWASGLTEQASAAGEVAFDPARVARISARAGGVTERVYKATGDPVRAGEVLALVNSPAVGKAKAELQQSLVQARLHGRSRDDLVGAKTVASPAALREAEAAFKAAEVRVLAAAQELGNLGLPVNPADYRTLSPTDAAERLRDLGVREASAADPAGAATLLPVRATFAGVVLSADVVAGEVVEAGKPLFTVVDPSRVWVTLHVGAEAARRAAVGQRVFFRPDGEAREVTAKVVWVGTAADEVTRTVPVRADAENAAGTLRASALGRGRVVFREEPKAVVLPSDAVQTFRGRTLVFVRDKDFLKADGPKAFHARAVTAGGRDERNTEILTGVTSGEVVATAGSDRLLAELTRATADR